MLFLYFQYAFLLTLILIIELVLVIVTFTLDPDTIVSYVNIPVWDYVYDPEIQNEIDGLQTAVRINMNDFVQFIRKHQYYKIY